MDIIKRVVCHVLFLLLLISPVLSITEYECEQNGGLWILPVSDDREGDISRPFCKCPRGYELRNNVCEIIETESLCVSSGGIWTSTSCTCPTQSTGWVDGFGCDYKHTIQSDNELGWMYLVFLGLALIILMLFTRFLLLKVYKRKRK